MTALDNAEHALIKENCRRSAQYFIFDAKVLLTKDEHDSMNPVKLFPPTEDLRFLLDCLLVSGRTLRPEQAFFALLYGADPAWLCKLWESGIIFIEKSRQVMATWLTCAYLFWRAKYRLHQLILVQSKREDDAANLVYNKEATHARISFMETHLPRWLQTLQFPKAGTYAHLFFPTGSHIWGIPEGGDIIRSNTPSVTFADEAAFQPEFGGSYTAALPAVKGGGQYIAVSSAEPGEFANLVEAA